jgi:hypothetical protein
MVAWKNFFLAAIDEIAISGLVSCVGIDASHIGGVLALRRRLFLNLMSCQIVVFLPAFYPTSHSHILSPAYQTGVHNQCHQDKCSCKTVGEGSIASSEVLPYGLTG